MPYHPGFRGVAPGPPPVGGNDANTTVLWNFDGVEGQTGGSVLTDEAVGGAGPNTLVHQSGVFASLLGGHPANNSEFSTALRCPGSNAHCTYSVTGDVPQGTGNMTIDLWYKRNGTQGAYTGFLSATNSGNNGWSLNHNDGGNQIRFQVGGTSLLVSNIPSNNVWTHVAVVRNGSNWNLYYDGNSVASASNGLSLTVNPTGYVGKLDDRAEYAWDGWLDQIRFSNIARWTSNFTPDTRPYDTG